MAKSKERNKAIILRKGGKSIKDIAKKIKVSKSTVSLWCRDIELTPVQVKKLHEKMVKGSYRGRMKGARGQYEKRLERIRTSEVDGIKKIGKMSERDLLIAMGALYWGEGSKKKRELRLNNTDPEMIKFVIKIFRKIWKVPKDQFSLSVMINKIHRKREEELKGYWSNITKIPENQFTKTIFIKSKNKKNYANYPRYYGTLTIKIKKSCHIYYQIMGLIKGLTKGI